MSLSAQQIEEFGEFALRISDAARVETLGRFRNGVAVSGKPVTSSNSEFDPVTEADREAERVIRERIGRTYPNHGVIGEEFGETKGNGPWCWVLDPVDGTRGFVCGVASWTTLIALEHENIPVLGLIDQPYLDERWIGTKGQSKFRHGAVTVKCQTSGVTDISTARVATTDPRPESYFGEASAHAFARLANECRVVRFSMDAYAYGLLALGEIDIVAEAGLKHHDYAALAPIVEGAGGVITNWRGERLGSDDRGEALAAATPALHETALSILNQ